MLASIGSVTYIQHHMTVAENFAAGGFPVNWQTQKDTHGVIPDASSPLWRTWWSILKQNSYRKCDLGLPLHPREQGLIHDLDAFRLSSQKDIQASAVSRESDGHCFLECLESSVGWFHTSRFNNKCRCLLWNSSTRLGGRYSAKETWMSTKGVNFAQQCLTSQCSHKYELI